MKKISIGIIVLVVAGLLLVIFFGVYRFRATNESVETACPLYAKICPDGSTPDRIGPNCEFAPCPDVPVANENMRVILPHPNDVIKSPVTIQGEAKGTWYFEGSFPIAIMGENGMLLGRGTAEARGNWMTTEFVPFEATIDFTMSPTATGSVILFKDNPSGLPENDARIMIPIRF